MAEDHRRRAEIFFDCLGGREGRSRVAEHDLFIELRERTRRRIESVSPHSRVSGDSEEDGLSGCSEVGLQGDSPKPSCSEDEGSCEECMALSRESPTPTDQERGKSNDLSSILRRYYQCSDVSGGYQAIGRRGEECPRCSIYSKREGLCARDYCFEEGILLDYGGAFALRCVIRYRRHWVREDALGSCSVCIAAPGQPFRGFEAIQVVPTRWSCVRRHFSESPKPHCLYTPRGHRIASHDKGPVWFSNYPSGSPQNHYIQRELARCDAGYDRCSLCGDFSTSHSDEGRVSYVRPYCYVYRESDIVPGAYFFGCRFKGCEMCRWVPSHGHFIHSGWVWECGHGNYGPNWNRDGEIEDPGW